MIAPNKTHRPTANGHAKWSCCGAPVVDPTYHPKCASKVTAPTAATPKPAPTVRAGAVHEARLCALLDLLGYIDIHNATRATPVGSVYVREFNFGGYLPTPRRIDFDVALVAQRVAFESVGGAHAAGKKKHKEDVERMAQAASLGWRVVTLTTEMIDDGRARDVIRAALGFVDRPATGKEAT